MRKEKITNIISNIDEKYINEANSFEEIKKDNSQNIIKWLALAAGIVIVAACSVAIYQKVSREESGHKAKLEDGSVISFAENKSFTRNDAKIAADVRELTEEEKGTIFGGLDIADVKGYFDLKDGSIIGASGKLGNIHIMASVQGKTIRDYSYIIKNTDTSYVNGVPVSAGYVVIGNENIVYIATLEFNKASVYLEYKGAYTDRNIIRKEITDAIEDVTQLGKIDCEGISFDFLL